MYLRLICFFFLFLIINPQSAIVNAQCNVWTQKADFGGTARSKAVGFSIGSKGYIGTGYDAGSWVQDFWEYDPSSNTWTQKANFGGMARSAAVGFSIGNKGYIGTGGDCSMCFLQDFWEYDLTSNTWTQMANFGGTGRQNAVGFSIGNKGYIGTGTGFGNNLKDFWEYDPSSNNWTQKANFGGTGRQSAVGFSIGGKGYIGTGYDGGNNYQDFWEYDTTSNTWTQRANVGGTARDGAVGFSIGSKGYVGTGNDSANWVQDFWEYDPSFVELSSSLVKTDESCTNANDGTATVSVTGGTSPYSYQWNDPSSQTASTATGLAAGTYSVVVIDINTCSINDSITIYSDLTPTQSICLITVDSTSTRNVIVWEKPISSVIDSFRIYRDIIGIYTHIGSVHYDSLSIFEDNTLGVNPQITSYRYKISVLDTCGNESVLSDFHKTIHLSVVPGVPPAMQLLWDDYEGFTFTYYRILRDTTGLGNWEAIDSVSFGINSRTDPTPPQTGNLNYLIEVVAPSVCVATKQKDFNSSKSNTSTSVTGINQLAISDLESLIIYPNPNTGQFEIEFLVSKEVELLQIKITNTIGQSVYTETLNGFAGTYQKTIDLKDMTEGVYEVQLIMDDKAIHRKIVVQK